MLQPFPLVQLSALRFVETSCCLAPDDVSATEHSASPVLLRGTACHPTFELHQHYQLLKTVSRLICFCSLTLHSLIRAAYFLYGALVVTLRTCYGALQIVVLLLLLLFQTFFLHMSLCLTFACVTYIYAAQINLPVVEGTFKVCILCCICAFHSYLMNAVEDKIIFGIATNCFCFASAAIET